MPTAIATVDRWDALREDAWAVRYAVFVQEQGVPVDLEQDDMDPVSLHAVIRDASGRPVATGRLLPDSHIGRIAVLPEARGKHLGSVILGTLMAQARERGDAAVMLHAQTHAHGFYEKHGFVADGPEFMEAGIPHVCMRHYFEDD